MDYGTFSLNYGVLLFFLWSLNTSVVRSATWAPSVGLNQLPFANMDTWSSDWVRAQARSASIERFLRVLLNNYVESGNPLTQLDQTLNQPLFPSSNRAVTPTGSPFVPTTQGLAPTFQPSTWTSSTANNLDPNQGMTEVNSNSVKLDINASHRNTLTGLNNESSTRRPNGVPKIKSPPMAIRDRNRKQQKSAQNSTIRHSMKINPAALESRNPKHPRFKMSSVTSASKNSLSPNNTGPSNNTKAILSKMKFPSFAKMLDTIDSKENATASPKQCDEKCPIAGVCNNGGTCVNTCSGFSCVCLDGFTGFFCDNKIDAPAVKDTRKTASKQVTTPKLTNTTVKPFNSSTTKPV